MTGELPSKLRSGRSAAVKRVAIACSPWPHPHVHTKDLFPRLVTAMATASVSTVPCSLWVTEFRDRHLFSNSRGGSGILLLCHASSGAALTTTASSIAAREKFREEVSRDQDVSLAKALLLVAAEDEAFMAFSRDKDAYSLYCERSENATNLAPPSPIQKRDDAESPREPIPLAGRPISGWMSDLDSISKRVEVELESHSLSRDLVASHLVRDFESRGFKRCSPAESLDPRCSYLHTVLKSGCGTAITLGIIYIEIYRRLGIELVGYRVGRDLWIWPQTWEPAELYKASPQSRQLSVLGLQIVSNSDMIGIALADLVRVHWKRASRMNRGLRLTSPLVPATTTVPLQYHPLRPEDLRLAIMASERLLILHPHNWVLRRDHGMLLFFSGRYGEAVQELSICMAFAPAEDAAVLERFVEKLHLLRMESSWKTFALL